MYFIIYIITVTIPGCFKVTTRPRATVKHNRYAMSHLFACHSRYRIDRFVTVFVPGIPTGAFSGRRYRFRPGHAADLEDPRRVPGQDNEHVLGDAVAEGVGHGGGAVQRDVVRAPASGEHGRIVSDRQRGAVRHLLPDPKADQPDVRRPQSSGLADHVRRDHVPAVPRAAERRPPQAGREHGPVPAAPLLHARVRSANGPR